MSEGIDKAVLEVARLARVGMGPITVGNVPAILVPDGYKIQSLAEFVYNDHAVAPERIKASPTVLDAESFIEYCEMYSADGSAIFADEAGLKIIGMLDYHESASKPHWCQHRVTLVLRFSEEWKVWMGNNNKQMPQMAFAEFLEQYALDITTPAPAEIMEVARDLQAHTEVSFGSGMRTQDGRMQFRYSEEIKATVGGGSMAVPEKFEVSLPVFMGGERVKIQALLRFRVNQGKLVIWYTLVRPEQVVREAFLNAAGIIQARLDTKILNGAPG